MVKHACLFFMVLLLTACGDGGGASSLAMGSSANWRAGVSGDAAGVLTNAPVVAGIANVLPLVVDAGPTGNSVDQLFTTVTLCKPGSSTECQTIDHVLVDTGSTGLRILSNAIASAMNLGWVTSTVGNPVFGCVRFIDGSFGWGPVVRADVRLAGETAPNLPIQVVGKPDYNALSGPCASSSAAINSASDLGANGILGVGLFKEDCGAVCDPLVGNNPHNGIYYTCNDATCQSVVGTTLAAAQQVKNPVTQFSSNKQGVGIVLPSVASPGAATVSGSMIFGIGTQSNNQFPGLTTLTTNSLGYINTQFPNTSLTPKLNLVTSFLDTGSNGLYFDSTTIPHCGAPNVGFYCPVSAVNATVQLIGQNSTSKAVSFSITRATTFFTSSNTALATLGGTIGDLDTFDWGLPFFFGRTVVIGVEGQASTLGTGPFYAF